MTEFPSSTEIPRCPSVMLFKGEIEQEPTNGKWGESLRSGTRILLSHRHQKQPVALQTHNTRVQMQAQVI